jgi:23S rRNA pseudouridine1911/1915/1917 synthase
LLVRLGWAPSRRRARELIAAGTAIVNGRQVSKGAVVAPDADVRFIELPQTAPLQPSPCFKIDVLYEDKSVLVVNKPGLVPCHPLRQGERTTLINAVVAVYPEVAEVGDKPLEGGLVHRLDNGTSGALIIARRPDAFVAIRAAIRHGEISRRYLALCAGNFEGTVEIATPIAHHPKNRRKMVTMAANEVRSASARPAATVVQLLQHYSRLSLVEAEPRTGRRHQIRVHLASIGHPLVGDTLYGGQPINELAPGRFWLHLSEIAFESPSEGRVAVTAPLPSELDTVLKLLTS